MSVEFVHTHGKKGANINGLTPQQMKKKTHTLPKCLTSNIYLTLPPFLYVCVCECTKEKNLIV